jgi:hypothetical protein
VGGGYVVQHWGWRAACAMAGLPGIAIAILIKVGIREPPRGYSEGAAADRSPPPFSIRTELTELRAVGRLLLADRPVLHMVLGVTIGAFAAYGFYAFVPPYFSRTFDLGYATIGVIAGLAGGVAVGMGIAVGGFAADALAERDSRWYALVPAIGGIIAVPLYGLAVLQADWKAAAALLATAGFFQYASLGPTFGVVQNVVDRRRRATATALLYICLNVCALGGGPLFTGWIIDRFAEADFKGREVPGAAQGAGSDSFSISCPGGTAAASAAEGIKSACDRTLAHATRRGILVTLLFFSWACVHYLLASFGIARSLKAAARASSVQSDST